MNNLEYRSLRGEVRATTEDDGTNVIEGYAAVWGTLSSIPFQGPRGLFFERIAKGAFAESIKTDEVGCFHDHNTGQLLGRFKNKTLVVTEDDHGLYYRCHVNPAVSYGKDVVALIERGDLFGNSFGMRDVESTWDTDEDGMLIRTVVRASLFDVGPVAEPVYTDTEVALRSLRAWQSSNQDLDDYLEKLDAIIVLNTILNR